MNSEKDEVSFFLEYKPKYKIFHELMSKRMRNVLLVSSIYDSFMLEEDGRLSDQIYEEFQNLNLRTLPRINRVSSAKEALEILRTQNFDLVITMRRLGEMDAFEFGKNVKEIQDIPVILLLTSVIEINYLPTREKRKGIDRVFVWNGDSKVFVAIIKHLEDKLNAERDIEIGDVRVFIFVEDSIRFYSLFLPELYSEIRHQTHRLVLEGTNDFQDLLKMRIRPKIILAETYEEAIKYYEKYQKNVIGVISDIEFPKGGVLDKNAGFLFVNQITEKNRNLPVLFQSTKKYYRDKVEEMGYLFNHKRSHGMLRDFRRWLLDYVGFGDFIFKKESGEIIGKAKDMISFYDQIKKVPSESLVFHGRNDHFSTWLYARGEFEIAEKLKPRKVSEFTHEEGREFLLNTINEVVQEKTRGIINDFSRENYNQDMLFLRLRPGSLGGKGRGLAFLMFLLNSFRIQAEFEDVVIELPRTCVIGTDEYDKFMDENNLYDFALSNVTDEEIKRRFIKAKLSDSIRSDLEFLMQYWSKPLAVRSSSLLEDSVYQPFAGIFSTLMIPNNNDKETNLNQLFTAIKLVYASVFLNESKSYAETISQTVDESKMAVIIQEVVGKEHNTRFYPDFSGTASSYNYYPFVDFMKPEDGIAHLALGLGRFIVDGYESFRFCPKYPKNNFYSTPDYLLDNSQTVFFALNLRQKKIDVLVDDPFVQKFDLRAAIEDETLNNIASTYDFNSKSLLIGYNGTGSPVITFHKQLKLKLLPIAEIIEKILLIGEQTMGCSIEIEFAVNIKDNENEKDKFNLLQIRPFLQQEMMFINEIETYEKKQLLAYSNHVSGNLISKDVHDIIYIKPESFDNLKTLEILREIDNLNSELVNEKKQYLLIGFGRWGTADRFLGVPVKWNNINGAKAIIETNFENFRIDFSQGSHFFHNMITSNIGYLHVRHREIQHFIDWDWLENESAVNDLTFVRHIRLKKPLTIRINAKRKEGMIIKPS
jgi:CheY-like chemotaxis protein